MAAVVEDQQQSVGSLNAARRPILVTGLHRSGTSWTGQMIALSPDVGYIHEPFSVNHHPGMFAGPIPFWFLHITDENEAEYLDHLRKTLSFSYSLGAELRAIRKPRHVTRIVRDGGRFMRHKHAGARPLLKDPLAIFSAEWLAATFDMQVVVLVRHPLSIAASMKRLGYRHPFGDFVKQPSLMEGYLQAYSAEIADLAGRQPSIAEEASLLWRMSTAVILGYQQRHPDWLFYRYEDLALDPDTHFEKIFRELEIDLTTDLREKIRRTVSPNVSGWKKQLTQDEVKEIRDRVGAEIGSFY